MMDEFIHRKFVVFISKDYDDDQLINLQTAIDNARGAPVRFYKDVTILEFCKHHFKSYGCSGLCVAYDPKIDRCLVYCSEDYYKSFNMKIIPLEDIPGVNTPKKLTEDDFDQAFEMR